MNCRQVRLALPEYIDGELSHARRFAVEAHLSGCAGCLKECESQRRMARLLAGMPRRRLGAAFDTALQSRLQAIDAERAKQAGWLDSLQRLRPRGLRDWRPLLAPLGIAALALALLRPAGPPAPNPVRKAVPSAYVARVVVAHLGSNDPRELPEQEAVDEALRANTVESLFQ